MSIFDSFKDLLSQVGGSPSAADLINAAISDPELRQEIQEISGRLFQIGILRDIRRNARERFAVPQPYVNAASSDSFVLYLPREFESAFFQLKLKTDTTDKFLATRVGQLEDVMRIRIVGRGIDLPELLLLVNPSSFTYNLEASHEVYYTRSGPHSEWNGNRPATLSFQGISGGFYGIDPITGEQGYNLRNYMQTIPFINIMSLASFYKSNGFVYGQSDVAKGASQSRDVINLGVVEIIYKHTIYRGSFDNMSLSFSDSNPNYLNFNFTFTAFQEESSIKVLR